MILILKFRQAFGIYDEYDRATNQIIATHLEPGGPVDTLRKAFANLSGVFGVFGQALSAAFKIIGNTFTALTPIISILAKVFEQLTRPIAELGKDDSSPFKSLGYINLAVGLVSFITSYIPLFANNRHFYVTKNGIGIQLSVKEINKIKIK